MAYDPQLDRLDTVIRGMYRMWRGRLHEHLESYGLTEAQGVLAFQDQPYPRTEKQVFELIARCPAVVPAAQQLLAQYQWIEGDTRKEYYEDEAVLRKGA